MTKRNIIIDLTSLLDVILILFFGVMLQTRRTAAAEITAAEAAAAAAIEERDAARASAEAAQESADALSRMLHTEDILLEHNLVLTLSVSPRDESLLIEADGESAGRIPYSWEENGYAYDQLRNTFRFLTHSFEEEAKSQDGSAGDFGIFMVFQYDSSRIRKGQYDAVQTAVQRLKAESGSVGLNYIELDVSKNTDA